MALSLSIPPLAEKADPSVEIRPVYVEEWMETLPYANPPVMLGRVYKSLHKLNRTPIKASTRFELMELFLAPYRYFLQLEEKQGPIHTIAGLEKNRAGTDATRRVAEELSYGYKHVIAGTRKGLWGKNKQIGMAVHRAMLFISHVMVHAFHEYLPASTQLWGEMASLYDYGMDNRLDRVAPAKSRGEHSFTSAFDHAYKRVLLTSLVDPYHLAYGEVWKVYKLLDHFADSVQISGPRTVEKPDGVFVLDPARDWRPEPYGKSGEGASSPECKVLDTNVLIDALEKENVDELKQRLADDGGISLGTESDLASLLRRMIKGWGVPPERVIPRESADGHVQIAVGITALYYLLGGTAKDLDGKSAFEAKSPGQPPPEEPQGDDEILVVISPRTNKLMRVSAAQWRMEQEEMARSAGKSAQSGAESADRDKSQAIFGADYWDLVNRGSGGVGIIKHIRPNYAIAVGELIGMEFFSGGQPAEPWVIGAVRWLSIAGAGEYQAGLQIFTRSSKPATVTIKSDAEGAKSRLRPALVLPRMGADSPPALVCAKGTHRDAVTAVLDTGTRKFEIKLGALVESTAKFERFHFEIIGRVDADTPSS